MPGFPVETAHGGAKEASILLTKPLSNWKDALADLESHSKVQYHTDSAVKMAAFCDRIKNPSDRIECRISSGSQQRVEHNRTVILSGAVRTARYCTERSP